MAETDIVPHEGTPGVVRSERSAIPALIQDAGPRASEVYANFLTEDIPNKNTREAYRYATTLFLDWCDRRRLKLETIRPLHVAAYREWLGAGSPEEGRAPLAPSSQKQHFSAIRRMFSKLVTNGVLEMNPAREVKTPRFSHDEGKTPVFDDEDLATVLASIDAATLVGKRDLALLSVMAYTVCRVGAAVGMDVDDFYPEGRKSVVRFTDKGGKQRRIVAHHLLEEALHDYLDAAGIAQAKGTPLFRTTRGRSGELTEGRMTTNDCYRMLRRRLEACGIAGDYSNHSLRATGITNFLTNGGSIERAKWMAGHADARTTALYDRRNHQASRADIELINYRVRREAADD